MGHHVVHSRKLATRRSFSKSRCRCYVSEVSCLLMIAQATRAVLFAKATAATSRGFRLSSEINQGSFLAASEQSRTVCALLTSRRRR
jgi:hypothetical protein